MSRDRKLRRSARRYSSPQVKLGEEVHGGSSQIALGQRQQEPSEMNCGRCALKRTVPNGDGASHYARN